MTERVDLLHLKLWPHQEEKRKKTEKYIEDIGKQLQTFTWFHGAAPAIAQPKHTTVQGENRVKLIEFQP